MQTHARKKERLNNLSPKLMVGQNLPCKLMKGKKRNNGQDRVEMDGGAMGEKKWSLGEQKWSLGERWNQFLFQVFILQGLDRKSVV